ncbi:hypothetical protein Pyn_36330 [Prunus yedoensis var. nudiflora]|uniref:Uncharacterized protein n=1 Tax=Prunus yedoensis var. nudiflora TaxID=2094558 RepID=A0A314YCI7_PRUYE|nr:hypothetical protein Pyn_36330 [Prunus yedoensis var. nudiflora]
MGRGRMDSRGWTPCIPSEVIDNWGIKCAGQLAHLIPKRVVQAIIAQNYARRRFVNRNCGYQVSDISSRTPTVVRLFRLSRIPLLVFEFQRQYKNQTSSFFLHTLRILKSMPPKSSL